MKRVVNQMTVTVVALLGCTMLATVYFMEASTSRPMLEERGLRDPDSFMWLNRATRLHETGDWYDHTNPRINPPVGHEQHWTRPMDAILLTGGSLLAPALGFDEGLYVWGLALSPLMHVATMLVLLWAALPLVRRRMAPGATLPIVVLVFAAQLPIYQSFLLGRPDHQMVLALLYVTFLGFWIRTLLSEGGKRRSAVGLGIVAGVATWVSIESLLFVGLGGIGLGLAWLLGAETAARRNVAAATSFFLTICVALAAERGAAGFGLRATDTLSASHVGLAAFVAASALWMWATERFVDGCAAGRRVVSILGVAALLAG